MDLAEHLAMNKIAVLIFYYQGSWGSEGMYQIQNIVPNTEDAVKYLKSQSFIDPMRVGLVSHCFGVVPLSNVMSKDKTIKTGVLMSPPDISKWFSREVIETNLAIYTDWAKGKIRLQESDYKQSLLDAVENLNPMAVSYTHLRAHET